MYRLFAARSLSFEEAELSLASRDYLDDCTAWNGGENKFLKLSANSADTTIKTLQEGVMPDALPQLQKVGDKLVMLFLRDVPERMTGNHTQLVYSVFDGGVWSEPKPVWDSETADFFFESVVDDGELYVVWQKLKSVPTKETPEDLLAEVAQNSEICFAKWNDETNEFTSQSYLTDDDELDMYPNVAVRDDLVSVVWVTNDENDPTGESGNYIIKRKDIINDAMGDVSELYSTTEFVTEMAAGYSDEELHILYAVLEEDAEKSNIYLLKGGASESLTSGNESASLRFVNNVFLWQSEGAIYRYDPTTQVLAQIITGENGSASSSYKYASNGTKSAIVWVDSEKNADTGKDSSVLKASIFADGEWSSPVVLLNNLDTNISYMDIELLENGEYAAILNTASFSEDQEVKTSLKFAAIYPHNDVELLYAAVDKANAQSNKQSLTIYLANNGDSVVPSIELSVDANGNNYLYKTLDVSLSPGEQIVLTEDIDISSINSVTAADVTVNIDEDSEPDNNRAQITLGHVDVSLSLDTYDLGDSVVFALTARNEANTVAHSAISIIEDSPEGIVLDVKNIGEVGCDDSVQYLYQIDKTQVQFDEFNSKTYFFNLESLEEDWNTEDNQLFYVVSQNPDETDVDPEGIMEEVKIVQPTSVDISVNKLHFDSVDSDSVQLSADIYPANSSINNILWSVEDPDIVYVDSEGLVTPLRPGTTTITSKVSDEVYDTITVTVADPSTLYKISAKAGTGGTVSGAGTFASGTEVKLTAKPNTNYSFEGWYEDGKKIDGTGAAYTFKVSKDRILEARFIYDVSGGGGYTGGGDKSISAALDVSEFKFDKSSPTDITVKLSSGSYTFREIKNGSYTLIPHQDYIVNGNMFTIKAAYLETLEDGQATLTFTMSGGNNPVLTVTVESGVSPVTEGDGVLLNGKETNLKFNPDGSVTINEEDISELSKPVILTLPYKDGGNSHAGVLKKDGQDVVMPFSVYKDNTMIILISEPGTYGVVNNKKNFN
ncbi:MAG TPA: X2-like carbohydrate binding domain-containing protein, partial [Acetivibrio sp.]|nr:X2-like carbohydrate binding domain-containing protein [Acetivibrio sp.]